MKSQTTIPPDHYLVRAFGLGLQYLASGRFAAASHFIPVAANLLHHAVEMFLKGALARHIGFDALPKGRNGHDLAHLWSTYQQQAKHAELDRFNALVAELHRFEYIRYPENLLREGGMLSIGFPSGARNVQLSEPKLPEYQVSVEDIDALVREIFRLEDINAEFFRSVLAQEHAEKYFTFRNEHVLLKEPSTNAPQPTCEDARG
jgi:hypothetical protein